MRLYGCAIIIELFLFIGKDNERQAQKQMRKGSFQIGMSEPTLYEAKIVKGKSNDKAKTKLSDLDIDDPFPVFYKKNER